MSMNPIQSPQFPPTKFEPSSKNTHPQPPKKTTPQTSPLSSFLTRPTPCAPHFPTNSHSSLLSPHSSLPTPHSPPLFPHQHPSIHSPIPSPPQKKTKKNGTYKSPRRFIPSRNKIHISIHVWINPRYHRGCKKHSSNFSKRGQIPNFL